MKKMRQMFLLIVLGTAVFNAAFANFNTLDEVTKYSQKLDEYVDKDNDDWLNPDYSSFHKKITPGLFSRLWSKALEAIGLRKGAWWSADYFKFLLQKVTHDRELAAKTGDFIEKMTPPTGTQYIIWGDIQGAFHSLIRDLNKLQKMQIIDNNFKIIKPDYYFIFNGNVIDRSPYILETLTLVLKIMDVNPTSVFYIRGTHEDKLLWENYGTVRELKIRTKYLSDEKIPLENQINRFFATLPLALYLRMSEVKKPTYVRISHFARNDERLDEDNFAQFLVEPSTDKIALFNLKEKAPSSEQFDIRVAIEAQSRSTEYDLTEGLKMINQDKGANAWSLLSAPTYTYRVMYRFFNDAFAFLTVGSKLYDWTIELYKQDVRVMRGFDTAKYTLLLGQPVNASTEKILANLDWKEIVVGCSLDLSRSSATTGKLLRNGIALRINEENIKLNENDIRIIFLDDGYTPALTRQNVSIFVEKFNADILLAPLGTPTVESILDKIQERKILALFPFTGASIFRHPNLRYIINFRASYSLEAETLIDYARATDQLKKFALFYQDDSYGKAALEGAQKALKRNGITDFIEVSYTRNTTEVDTAAKKITEFGPDAILFFSTFSPSAELVRKLNIQTLASQTLMGISYLGSEFRDFMKQSGFPFTISRVVPDPNTSELQIAKNYRDTMKSMGKDEKLNFDSFEGYIDASLFIEAFNSLDKPVTKEKLITFFESFSNHNFLGLNLTFNPENRSLSNDVWIDTGKELILARNIKKH